MKNKRKCRYIKTGDVYGSVKELAEALSVSIYKVNHILRGRVKDSIGIEYVGESLKGAVIKEAKCIKCNIVKPREDFGIDKRTNSIRCYTCQKCRAKGEALRRASKPKSWHRVRSIMNTYKVTIEEAERLYLIKKCECCDRDLSQNELHTRKADGQVVDHNHKTGKVRGVLCSGCNLGLGHFNDDTSKLENAIKYINKTNKL
tara:strand:+ start:255 stop:860 length:606 start_codon:yes stop_codon:yes gene_type:complete